MEDILLCNACVSAEITGVELAVKIFVYSSLHPNVYGECVEIIEAEKGSAGGNLKPYSEDF